MTPLDPGAQHEPAGPGGTPDGALAALPGVVVVPVPVDATARAVLVARVEALVGLEHPHLVAVRDAAAVRPGALDVRYARGDAADLPTVLAARGRLTAAESAGVLVAVAQALAALHSAGIAHGPLAAGDVVVRPDGVAALRPRAALPPEGWSPADDVRALAAAVGDRAGAADDAEALRAALRAARHEDPHLRPEAGTLAARVHEACPPAPLRLPDPATLVAAALTEARAAARGPAPAPARRRPRRAATRRAATRRAATRRAPRAGARPSRAGSRRLRLPVALGGAALVAGVLTGALLELRPGPVGEGGPSAGPAGPTVSSAPHSADAGRGGDPARAVAADPTRDEARPADAAAALTQRRLDLLAGAVGDVGAVAAPGSDAYVADAALRDRLAAEGPRPVRPRATVHRAEVVAPGPGAHATADAADDGGGTGADAAVRVEYEVEAHQQRGADGDVTQVPASERRTATLVLRWTAAGWRVAAVS
ncbi:hypothetical protein [Puerhibacterium sp. TATVAM-FAB25]|uniref:hypothetical protein n=1 Tax=Puerhibacterium sp. TATVAM-FAB25 TaxID=3093699 RepID=UPI00397BCA91